MSLKSISIFQLIIFIISLILISSHPKADKLRELTLSSDRGLIVLNAQTYKEYVMSHPRPYDIVILYTLSRKCNLCERVFNEFIQVSDSFRDSNGFKPDMISRKRAVFFAVLYYSEETMPIFKSLKFPSMTNILYTTPQNIQFNQMGEPYIEYDEDYVISYNERSDKIYALKMMEFANAKSQRKFPLKKNPIEFLIYFLLFVFLIFVGFSAYQNFHSLLLSPILWVIGSMLVVIICMGGIVYNILHSTPFAKYDRDGNGDGEVVLLALGGGAGRDGCGSTADRGRCCERHDERLVVKLEHLGAEPPHEDDDDRGDDPGDAEAVEAELGDVAEQHRETHDHEADLDVELSTDGRLEPLGDTDGV